jgi:hypothetical protein
MAKGEGNIVVGMLLCWLLNAVHLGIAAALLYRGESRLPQLFILVGAMGLLQLVYVVPIYRLLKRHGKDSTAKGLVIAAAITALLNAGGWGALRLYR